MIKGWHKLSMVDYPGHLCTILFFGGCNLRCFYCHNRQISFAPHLLDSIDPSIIYNFLEKRRGFIEGVCFSGGEPTISEGLQGIIVKIKKMGYKIKLDTNGTYPGIVKKMVELKLLDYIAMDVKAPKNKYRQITGVDLNLRSIEESIEFLKKEEKVKYEFRTTIVPGFFKKDDIKSLARWLAGAEKYVLQPWKGKGGCMSEKDLKQYAEVLKPYFRRVEVR